MQIFWKICNFFFKNKFQKISRIKIKQGGNAFKLNQEKFLSLIPLLQIRETMNIYPEETYETIFNFYNKKQYSILGFPFEISFSKLYLQIENYLYTFEHFYSLDSYAAQYFKIFVMFILIFLISNLLF